MAVRRRSGRPGTATSRWVVGVVVALAVVGACTADPPSATLGSGATAFGPTTSGQPPTTSLTTTTSTRPSTTTTSTTSSTIPDPAALELEPLLLVPDTSSAPIRREDAALTASDLAARPFLGSFDVQTAPPDPDLAAALEGDGLDQGFRGTAFGRSYPSTWTITIVRFATPEGATRSAARLTDLHRAGDGAADGGSVAGIPGSALVSGPAPPNNSHAPTASIATFVVGRHLAIVAVLAFGDPEAPHDWITRIATLQHDQLIEMGVEGA